MPDDAPQQRPELGHTPPRADVVVLMSALVGALCVAPVAGVALLAGWTDQEGAVKWITLGACAGLMLGLVAAALLHMPSDHRSPLWACIRTWMIGGGALLATLCSPMLLFSSQLRGRSPLVSWGVCVLLGLLLGGLIGVLRGMALVRRRLDEERRQFEGDVELHGRRAALASAIEARFGPLGDERRQRIQGWDERRIADVASRLPNARSIEDVD